MDPLNGGTSLSPLPGDVNAQSGRRWPRPRELRFCLILGIPSWLMPLRDRSGQRWQPLGKPYVEPVPFLGAHTAYTCKRGEVFLGVSNEVRLLWFSSPPFGSPFHPFPFHTPFVSSFLSCPPVFMSGHLILFFVCAHIGPGLSVYVHFYLHLNTGFRSPRSSQ